MQTVGKFPIVMSRFCISKLKIDDTELTPVGCNEDELSKVPIILYELYQQCLTITNDPVTLPHAENPKLPN